jgi:dienelactone hydrolase
LPPPPRCHLLGAKVAIGVGSETSLFNAVSMVHPAMLSVDDATKLAMPVAVYISKDEDQEEYNKIVKVIGDKPFAAKNDHKIYSTMFHGWAAARANLKDEENNKQFKDVYSNLVKFFGTTLA